MYLELFLFAKNMKFSTKGGIRYTSRSARGAFIVLRGPSLVKLKGHDHSAADIMVHLYIYSMYCCIHTCYAPVPPLYSHIYAYTLLVMVYMDGHH